MPALRKLVDAGVFDVPEEYDTAGDDDFDYGLSIYLDGVAARVAQYSATR
jgi:hypothetical protein